MAAIGGNLTIESLQDRVKSERSTSLRLAGLAPGEWRYLLPHEKF